MYNKLCNKQDGLFSSSMSYLHKKQGSPNEFKTHTKHLISSSHFCFMATISSFIVFTMLLKFIRVSMNCKNILNSYNKKLIILIL
jgi:hypothetical protein